MYTLFFCQGYTLLHWAACWGHLDLVKYFVDANVNIFLRSDYDETATALAERNQNIECLAYLKKAG
jgi:FOG: Ankyrin repeat